MRGDKRTCNRRSGKASLRKKQLRGVSRWIERQRGKGRILQAGGNVVGGGLETEQCGWPGRTGQNGPLTLILVG